MHLRNPVLSVKHDQLITEKLRTCKQSNNLSSEQTTLGEERRGRSYVFLWAQSVFQKTLPQVFARMFVSLNCKELSRQMGSLYATRSGRWT